MAGMTYNEALSYIHSNFWQGSKPGLERTEKLLELLHNPQEKLKFIHVAGTNGKGSFCAMLSSVLTEAGYKVGTFTSPYILRFNERMKIYGKDIPDQVLADLTEKIRPLAEKMEEKPTEFELITAIAMEYFKEENCDLVVLECGMGGRLDSTNIISSSLISVITGISLDHTSFLGNSIEEIAGEKAGIIKENCPVLFCQENKAAEDVIRSVAEKKNAPFLLLPKEDPKVIKSDLEGTSFDFGERKDLFIPLLAPYQVHNAKNVLCAVDLLKKQNIQIPDDAIYSGLKKVRWPARYEMIAKDPVILYDGSHNPEGVDSAVESTKLYFKDKKPILVTGVMADKDYGYMAKRMSEIASFVYCITPENPRALKGEEFAKTFEKLGTPAVAVSSPKEGLSLAIRKAKEEGNAILCLGSLYMYGEIYTALKELGF